MAIEIVGIGTWVYGRTADAQVWIVRADFDFWYEVAAADAQLEPGEQPDLNEEGVSYYVVFRQPEPDQLWPDGGGFPTRKEAQRDAERRVPTAIRWAT
jgi:hypothetical protein